MIFDLICKNKFDELETWKYDAINSRFVDPQGNVKFFEKFKDRGFDVYPFYKNDNPYKYTNESIKVANIVLGNKCNFHCPFCAQKYNFLDKKINVDNIDKIFERLKQFPNLNSIFFMAGETLVYWKVVSKIIEKAREVLDNNIKIKIVSNGSLLTKEIADFIIKNDVRFLVSYDGKNAERDFDIFENKKIVDVLKYIISKKKIKLEINYLPTIKCNESITEIRERIGNVLGKDGFYTIEEERKALHFTNSRFKERIDIVNSYIPSKEQKEKLITNRLEGLKKECRLKNRIDDIVEYVKNGGGFRYNGCGIATGASIVFDMDGNVYSCLNDCTNVIGNLFNLNEIKLDKYIHPLRREKCKKCCFVNICNGGSYKMKENDVLFDINCSFEKVKSETTLRYICKTLFDVELLEIKEAF